MDTNNNNTNNNSSNALLIGEIRSLSKRVADLETKLLTAIQAIPTKAQDTAHSIAITDLDKILKDYNAALISKVNQHVRGKNPNDLASSSLIVNLIDAAATAAASSYIPLVTHAGSKPSAKALNSSSTVPASTSISSPGPSSSVAMLTAMAKAANLASEMKPNSFHRLLPENYKLPNTNVKTFWDLWYGGNQEEGVPPLHTVKKNKRYNELDSQDKKTYSKGKSLMAEIEHFAKKEGLLEDSSLLHSMTTAERDEAFYRIYEVFVLYVYGKKCHRPLDKSVGTLLNRLREVKKEHGVVDETASVGSSSVSSDGEGQVPAQLTLNRAAATIEIVEDQTLQPKKKQKISK